MTSRTPKPHWISLALVALAAQAQAQTAAPTATDQPAKLEKIVVTGSLIKRTDKETPSVVQTISREAIANSGFATVEELLRATSAVDASSISDGAGSGFVSGLATISLRGFGSQGTLVLINGRRTAPVAAVDINFGRGSLTSVNSIPRGAIERIDILKDGASALYGSDAMAGVVNYILRKDYQGAEATVGYSANDDGVGQTVSGGVSFGFGNLDTQGFNVFGGIEMSKRDPVMHSELKGKGDLALTNQWNNFQGFLSRFTPDSVASPFGSYYRVPASNAGSTSIDGRTVGNSSPFGANYLGTYPGCPPELTVGQGTPARPDGPPAASPSFRNGQCRFNLDNADEAISKQDRVSAVVRGTVALGGNFTAYADLMLSKTETKEQQIPLALTTTVVSSANPVALQWSTLSGQIQRQNALILPVGHPDNPTNGTATPTPVQVIYRFADLNPYQTQDLESKRLTVGLEGSLGDWDIDAAIMHSRQDNVAAFRNRVRKSLLDGNLNPSSANFGKYRFNGTGNNAAAIASVASDTTINGEAAITSADVRASRDLFAMAGGNAAVALGLEYRRETLNSVPDDVYKSGDYVGLVGNGASGKRNLWAAFSEFRLPVLKDVEVQAAARHEKYSDFGDSTTGKLGAKWQVLPSTLALRGTVATGFRAPGLSQIGDAFLLSFNSFQTAAYRDPIRCPNGVSLSDPPVLRDCNILGRNATNAAGSIPTIIAANPNLKAETSKSATAGVVFSPTRNIDLAIDAWYFERNNEIRVQRSIDILDRYIANPTGPEAAALLRDPNPATWLPGVPNSGPILVIYRGYGNFNWSKTSGVDYDLNIRFPMMDIGRVSFNLNGTYTGRFDQQVLTGGAIDRYAGTDQVSIPKTRATATLRLDRDNWGIWGRYNHADKLRRVGVTEACLASTTPQDRIVQSVGGCYWMRDESIDVGFRYSPMKGLTISGALLNALDYYRATNVPSSFTHWDSGNAAMLGRRFSLSLTYAMN